MSSNLPLPVRILVIEDDEKYFKNVLEERVEQFNKNNKEKEILLEHALTSEEGKGLYNRNGGSSYYNGVIIDFLGVREKGGTKAESSSFVGLVKFFDGEDIAKVVITGQKTRQKEVEELCSGEFDLYFKGSSDRGEGKMLSDLWEKIQNSEEAKILNEHSEVFRVFGGNANEISYLEEATKRNLLRCLKQMNSSEEVTIRGNLASLRVIQEEIFYALSKHDAQMVPEEYVTTADGTGKKNVKFSKILYHLKGKYDQKSGKHLGTVYTDHESLISKILIFVYKGCSDGLHAIDDDEPIKPTKYTVKAITHAVLDLLLWYKKVVNRNTQ